MESSQRWKIWLAVLVGIVITGVGLAALLSAQGSMRLGHYMAQLTAALQFIWLCYGLWSWRERFWVRVSGFAILGTYAVIAILALCTTWSLHPFVFRIDPENRAMPIAAVGIWAMTLGFVGGLALIRLLLTTGHPVIGVARTFVDEAIRMKVAVIFVVLLAVLIPLLAVGMDPAERLQYRVQFFLNWSMGIVSLTLSLVTIFLTCWSVTSEMQFHQIYLTMTKPVGRWQYLLGKWLGMALLNLLFVVVSGAGIFAFTMILKQQPARDQFDRVAVDEEILTARIPVAPMPPPGMDMGKMFEMRLTQLQKENPERYGDKPSDRSKLSIKDEQEIQKLILQQWHTIPPLGIRGFLFTGLKDAKKLSKAFQLKLTVRPVKAPPDGLVQIAMRINGRDFPMRGLAEQVPQVLPIPTKWIDDNGNALIEIANVNPNDPQRTFATDISFTSNEGILALYQVGTFEPNFVRTLIILWVRLIFLAVVGIAASTFLGFHVAALLAMMIFLVALSSGFITEALTYYGPNAAYTVGSAWDVIMVTVQTVLQTLSEGKYWDATKVVIRLAGKTCVSLIPSFSTYDAAGQMSEGLLVPWELVLSAWVWVAGIWSAVLGLAGWVIFARRELARVTV